MSCYQESEVVQRHFYQSRYQQFKNGDSIKLRVAYRNKDNGLYVYGDDQRNIIFHDFENTWWQSHWEYRHHNHPEKANYIKRIHYHKKRMPTRSELEAKLSNEKPKVYIKSLKKWYQDPFGKSPLEKALHGKHWKQEGGGKPAGVPYRVTEIADLVKKWERFRVVAENK